MAINQVDSSIINELGINKPQQERSKELGQEDFLTLLVAQLRNQDPTKPTENGEFLSQIAQFGTLDGIQKMQGSMDNLADTFGSQQALQASSLVGRSVQVPTNTKSITTGEAVEGTVELPGSVADLTLRVENSAGEAVRQVYFGAQAGGDLYFKWDGLDEAGDAVPPGNYRIKPEATVDGEKTSFDTLLSANVESVILGKPGEPLVLNLAGIGSRSLSEIRALQ